MDSWEKLLGGIFCVVLGVLLKAVIDWKTKPKKRLGIFSTVRSIIEPLSKEGLVVTYHGEVVDRLDSHRIIFRNKGNAPLEKIPVTIKCSGPVRGKVTYIGPDGKVDWSASDEAQGSPIQSFGLAQLDTHLVFERSLLNERESFAIEFLIANGDGTKPEVMVRSPGLELISLFGKREMMLYMMLWPWYVDSMSMGPLTLRRRDGTPPRTLPMIEGYED